MGQRDGPQAGIEAGAVEGLLMKLIVLAFRCDRTRYASYLLEFAFGGKRWSSEGSPMGAHDLSHSGNGSNPGVVPRTHMKLSYLAEAMREMAAIDEGRRRGGRHLRYEPAKPLNDLLARL